MIIGLTGGICSGKTAVTDILREQNAYIINADIVYRDLSAEGEPLNLLIKQTFPDCIVSGALDKTLLYKKIFNNPTDRELLNKTTHPSILQKIQELLRGRKEAIVEVPLLFESGFNKLCDLTVGIIAPTEKRIKRLQQRSNRDEEWARKIIAAQISDEELIKKCNYIICNDGSAELLKERVLKWWANLKAGTIDKKGKKDC